MKQIVKNFLKGVRQIGEETGKDTLEQTGKIIAETISPEEWLGGIKPMGGQEYQQMKQQSISGDAQELAKLRAQMKGETEPALSASGPGRNVEAEMRQVVRQKEQTEEEKEKEFLEKLKRQREEEQQEVMTFVDETANYKRKRRGSAFAKGKGKASTADMSATAEYYKKPD